jgi:hypothetical protein
MLMLLAWWIESLDRVRKNGEKLRGWWHPLNDILVIYTQLRKPPRTRTFHIWLRRIQGGHRSVGSLHMYGLLDPNQWRDFRDRLTSNAGGTKKSGK